MLLCLSVSEFPSHSGNEIEPEVRKSRAAVIASEPIPETVEITRTTVKKTVRLVIITAEERISHLSKTALPLWQIQSNCLLCSLIMYDGFACCVIAAIDYLRSRWLLSPSIISETNLIVKAIQKNDFLSRLDDEQTAMMVDLLVVSKFKPGDDVIKEGSEGDSMYIVAGGDTPECVWMCFYFWLQVVECFYLKQSYKLCFQFDTFLYKATFFSFHFF